MQESLKPKLKMSSRIVKIAAAVGFALVIGSFGVGPAGAADNNRGGGNHVAQRGGGDRGGYRGGGGRSGPTVVDNYYAPQPDYYASPEPYNYYGNGPGYDEPAPQGISLFFGL
jgi:hypothetical protein